MKQHSVLGLTPNTAKARKLLLKLDLPDYFPTPQPLIQRMVLQAGLEDGQRVLEPSAGDGAIALAIQSAASVHLDVVEIQPALRKILEIRQFNIIAWDFLEVQGTYDRILQNPPFSQVITHIQHAYQCLASGGRLVTVAPESLFRRRGTRFEIFRDWLEQVEACHSPLPNGTFLSSARPTDVRTRLVVIER